MEQNPALPWHGRLHWRILIAMVAGVLVGWLIPEASPYVSWLGTLFVRLLRMVIVPLVLTSIICGTASIGGGNDLGRLFAKTLGFFVLTSLLAILLGWGLVVLIQPGIGLDTGAAATKELPTITPPASPLQMVFDMVPTNVVKAMAEADMLGLIFFCIVFGMAITGLPEEPRQKLIGVLDAAFQAMMKLTTAVVHFAPIGVFGLMAKVVADSGFSNFKALGLYMVTIATGLVIHFFVTLPLLMILLSRLNPWTFLRNMTEPIAMAFSTSSSGATLPVTMKAVEDRVGVPNRISSFVLPMGATINMNGTALYECAGVLFIAQALGIALTPVQQLLVVFTALMAAIGAAAVPSAGLVMIFMVLEAVNLRGPQVDAIVGMMLAIDRPLDMCRTVVNIYSDAVGAAVIAKSEGVEHVNEKVVPLT